MAHVGPYASLIGSGFDGPLGSHRLEKKTVFQRMDADHIETNVCINGYWSFLRVEMM